MSLDAQAWQQLKEERLLWRPLRDMFNKRFSSFTNGWLPVVHIGPFGPLGAS